MDHRFIMLWAAASVGILLVAGCSDDAAEKTVDTKPASTDSVRTEKPKKEKKKISKKHLGKKRKAALPVIDAKKRSLDKINPKFVSRMTQSAIDNDDYAKMSAIAARARNSKDPKVRAVVVEALGWFQQKAIPDLVLFVNDDDPEVSTVAIRLVDDSLNSVENDRIKADFVEMALPYTTDDMVDTIVSKLDSVDSRVSFLKLMSLMEAYGDDPVVKDSLIRQYEFMSGEEFTGEAAAHRWFFKSQKEKGRTR